MAKFHLDKLKKKYKGIDISGNVYSDIVKQIIENNSVNIQNKIFKMSTDKWKGFTEKYRPSRETKLVMPLEENVFPKRGIQIRKAAEKGKFITETLRDSLTKDLRKSLFDEDMPYLKKRGVTAGRINPDLIKQFEKDIRGTFKNYSKKDPKLGVPSNVHGMAVTEVRGVINDTKNMFTKEMINNNPHLIIKKKWIQNRNLAKRPRRGHSVVDGTIIDFDDFFKVPLYKEVSGKYIKIATHLMRYPHDPTAILEQVIGCNCDYDVIVSKARQRKVS